ncbi:MAG: DegT/DnrJ/EryC1/StrS family aminotransferase, partial [Duncaniella sp.]|nr:DegT/DnrJ/EryC1/StrS family aminotransferase [Duncaniella sp.]
EKYDMPVLEDAAEALGSEYKGQKCGTLGRYGALSFNGNKIITTSGGGALVCPSAEAAARVKFYATQSRENRPYYYHEVIGFNYRLSNISAAIGCGQIESLQERVDRRRGIHHLYREMLEGTEGITVQENPSAEFNSNFWLSTILIDPATGITPDGVRVDLMEKGIETRLLWRPMHMMPFFADAPAYTDGTAESLFERGLCLPSGSSLTDEDIIFVAEAIKSYVNDHRI